MHVQIISVGGLPGLAPDGLEHLIVVARDRPALDAVDRLVGTSRSLPGEDPALLPGPDRVDRCATSGAFGPSAETLAGGHR